MKARISYLVAAGFAALVAQHDLRRIPKVFPFLTALRATSPEWVAVLVLLGMAIAARKGATEKRLGILIGASLVVAPFAILAIAESFGTDWPWVASALAAAVGDALVWSRVEGSGL